MRRFHVLKAHTTFLLAFVSGHADAGYKAQCHTRARHKGATCSAAGTGLTCTKGPNSLRHRRFRQLDADVIKGYLNNGVLPNEYTSDTDKKNGTLTGNPDGMDEYIAGNAGMIPSRTDNQEAFVPESGNSRFKISAAAETDRPRSSGLGAK